MEPLEDSSGSAAVTSDEHFPAPTDEDENLQQGSSDSAVIGPVMAGQAPAPFRRAAFDHASGSQGDTFEDKVFRSCTDLGADDLAEGTGDNIGACFATGSGDGAFGNDGGD